MNQNLPLLTLVIFSLSLANTAMARNAQYDEEARQQEKMMKDETRDEKTTPGEAAKRFVGGIKQTTVDSTTGLISETADSTRSSAPVVGTLEGARLGSGAVLDSTVKGAVKLATLGYGEVENYDVVEPESGSGEPTKIRFSLPGT